MLKRRRDLRQPARLLVTGASGELGAAIARRYAEPGCHLSLWGRDQARLDVVAAACRRAGATVVTRSLDLVDVDAALAAVASESVIDLALLVAGQGDIKAPEDAIEEAAQVTRLGIVNFVAPSAMAAALASRMAAQGGGGVVLIGSAAAFHPLPFAAAYAASKAGLAHFAEALRIGAAAHGVRVTLVSPGFIDTAAGRRTGGPRPFSLDPTHVADRIARAAARGRAHLVLPWPFRLLRRLDRLLPSPLRDRLLLSLEPRSAGSRGGADRG